MNTQKKLILFVSLICMFFLVSCGKNKNKSSGNENNNNNNNQLEVNYNELISEFKDVFQEQELLTISYLDIYNKGIMGTPDFNSNLYSESKTLKITENNISYLYYKTLNIKLKEHNHIFLVRDNNQYNVYERVNKQWITKQYDDSELEIIPLLQNSAFFTTFFNEEMMTYNDYNKNFSFNLENPNFDYSIFPDGTYKVELSFYNLESAKITIIYHSNLGNNITKSGSYIIEVKDFGSKTQALFPNDVSSDLVNEEIYDKFLQFKQANNFNFFISGNNKNIEVTKNQNLINLRNQVDNFGFTYTFNEETNKYYDNLNQEVSEANLLNLLIYNDELLDYLFVKCVNLFNYNSNLNVLYFNNQSNEIDFINSNIMINLESALVKINRAGENYFMNINLTGKLPNNSNGTIDIQINTVS